MLGEGFEDYARVALRIAGREVRPGDLEVLRAVVAATAPVMGALDALDIRGLPPERALDPGHPPATLGKG